MPNHISNRLTLDCDDVTAASVWEAVSGNTAESLIDFNRIVPYPKHFADADLAAETWRNDPANRNRSWSSGPKDGFNHGGYDWCVENWGTKWNAYEQRRIDVSSIYFETAWTPPLAAITTLSRYFPTVAFRLEFANEDVGSNAGRALICQGRVNVVRIKDLREAARLWFDLTGNDPKEWEFDPVTMEPVEIDE